MLKKLLRTPYPYIYLLTYYGVWLIWDGLRVPFKNPLGIISSLPTLGYNPTSNVLRFLAAVVLPPLACLLYWYLQTPKNGKRLLQNVWLIRSFKAFLVIFPLIMALCMGIIQASTHIETNAINGAYGGPYKYSVIDTFHEGETLGTAESYSDPHLKPYRDFVFLHGVFQDPLRTVIAFKLFGRSIGAARTFAAILTIATFFLYYVLLLVLFRKNLIKAALGMSALGLLLIPSSTIPILYPYIVGVNLPFRDIATILFLLAAILGFRYAKSLSGLKLLLSSVAIGFVAVAGFANSIDRAFYILALSFGWLLLVTFMTPKNWLWLKATIAYGVGALLGVPVLGLALKWDFKDFISFLRTISSQKEFLDGVKFARPDAEISLLLIALGASVTILGALFIRGLSKRANKTTFWQYAFKEVQSFVSVYHLHILLTAAGLVFMRSAIGRASIDHFNYSVTWFYLLVAFVGIELVFAAKKNTYLATFISCLLLLFLTGQMLVETKRTDIKHDTFPLHVKDAEIVRTDHQQTVDFLKKNLHGNETFATLTSEGSWYYLANKPSPLKYPIIWFAFMPEERKNLATSLQNHPEIKYIVTNSNWTTNFDYVPNDQRFPELYKVFTDMYVPAYGFGQQTVWQRKAN